MLHLLQIMSHMFRTIDNPALEIDEAFTAVENGDHTIEQLLDIVGVTPTKYQLQRIKTALPKWRVALSVTEMKFVS